MIATPYDSYLLTATVYGEARGEPTLGKVAVAWVVRTRATARGLTVPEVVLAPVQFSCWGDPRACLLGWHDAEAWRACGDAAAKVLTGEVPDPTNGATHYLNVPLTKQQRGRLPAWAADPADSQRVDVSKVTVVIGAHTFLRLDA